MQVPYGPHSFSLGLLYYWHFVHFNIFMLFDSWTNIVGTSKLIIFPELTESPLYAAHQGNVLTIFAVIN